MSIGSIIHIPKYDGTNECAERIRISFRKASPSGVLCALVHGSVACGDEIPYSDFDGLVILKDESVDCGSTKVPESALLRRTEREMFRYDPLQHHGWFRLRESELARYPEHYLPSEVLNHGRVLWPEQKITLRVQSWIDRDKIRNNFGSLCASVRRPARSGIHPKNMYQLKGLLSQFMLLPAAYLQVRDGQAVFKEKSFQVARVDFAEAVWSIMDTVSEIRRRWMYSIGSFQRWMLTRRAPWHYAFAKRFSPAIPKTLQARLDSGFYQRLAGLAEKMEQQLA